MSRLPMPGSDNSLWGDILNDFLIQSHNADGSLKLSAVAASGAATDSAVVHISGAETISGVKTFGAAPILSTITNTGTLTLPTGTDTLTGRATTDTLTNKTISGASNTLSNIPESAVTNLTADLAGKAAKIMIVVDSGGSGDYTTIAAALAAVPAGGAEIFIKRGTYTITSSLNIPSNTTVCGEGESSIIKLGDNAGVNMLYVGPSVADVVIKDLKIDGNRANNSVTYNTVRIDGTRVRVMNCHVTSANGYNLVAWNGSVDVHFSSNVSEDARDEGIEFMGCNRGSAIGNHVRNIGKNAILVWANVAQSGTSSGIIIKGNVISGAAALTASFAGIKVDDGATDVIVQGNVVLAGGTTSPGIRIDSNSATTVNNITVSGNTVVGSTAEGILVANASNVVVANNIVRGCALAGIKLSGATCLNAEVTGNSSTGNTTYGVYADTVTGPQITGNNCSGNTQQGVILNACTDITLAGNRSSSNGGTTFGGFDVTNCTGGTVTGNTIRGTGATGINAQGSTGLTITGNAVVAARSVGIYLRDCTNIVCSSNVCRNNGQGGNVSLYNGIMVTRVSATTANITITGNRCFDDQGSKTQGYGIRVIGTADNIHLSGNILDGNSVVGFGTDGTATNLTLVPTRKITATVGTSQTTVAHGLPYAPQTVSISMTSTGTIWRSAVADATNVYLTADAASRTADVLVG